MHNTFSGHKSWRISYKEGIIYYVHETPVLTAKCSYTAPKKEKILFYNVILTYTLGIWIPALILLILHIVMFRKLNAEGRLRTQTSTMDSRQQMKRIMKTFSLIIIAFYVCILPNLLFMTHNIYYTIHRNKRMDLKLYDNMKLAFVCLQNINSCLNPLIYAKIHHKIYIALRKVWQYLVSCTMIHQSQAPSIKIRESTRKREPERNHLLRGENNVLNKESRV